MGKVVYLTGAPASGKSTTTKSLAKASPRLLVWEYGARLTEHIKARTTTISSQDDLRSQSASVVTPQDIEDVDLALLRFVRENRETQDIIIDSHAVTKEVYGYRITPFSLEQFRVLAPDEIWLFYAPPDVTMERIAEAPGGRPSVTEEEARMHTMLQASVAATYGMAIGKPVYLFDTALDRNDLVARLLGRLQ